MYVYFKGILSVFLLQIAAMHATGAFALKFVFIATTLFILYTYLVSYRCYDVYA